VLVFCALFESEIAAGAVLKFPRKKLRDKLTHYSIGKASAELLAHLPEEDFLRARGEKNRRPPRKKNKNKRMK
jgi:hypothetical protein